MPSGVPIGGCSACEMTVLGERTDSMPRGDARGFDIGMAGVVAGDGPRESFNGNVEACVWETCCMCCVCGVCGVCNGVVAAGWFGVCVMGWTGVVVMGGCGADSLFTGATVEIAFGTGFGDSALRGLGVVVEAGIEAAGVGVGGWGKTPPGGPYCNVGNAGCRRAWVVVTGFELGSLTAYMVASRM
jgi:hypothetical protein